MKKNKYKYHVWPFVLGTIIVFFLVFGVIEVMALYEQNEDARFTFVNSADKWIALVGAILSYIGTCFVGIIAMWQNNQLSKINVRLLRIEEVKLIPKLNFKPGRLTFPADGGTCFSFIIEHKSGDVANNPQIKNITLKNRGVQLTLVSQPILPQNIYAETYRSYNFMCSETLTEFDEADMSFTLCFADVLNEVHEISVEIHWDMQVLHRAGDSNSNDPSLSKNDKRELVRT